MIRRISIISIIKNILQRPRTWRRESCVCIFADCKNLERSKGEFNNQANVFLHIHVYTRMCKKHICVYIIVINLIISFKKKEHFLRNTGIQIFNFEAETTYLDYCCCVFPLRKSSLINSPITKEQNHDTFLSLDFEIQQMRDFSFVSGEQR